MPLSPSPIKIRGIGNPDAHNVRTTHEVFACKTMIDLYIYIYTYMPLMLRSVIPDCGLESKDADDS